MTPANLIQALRQFRCNGAYIDICLQAAAVIETYEAELNELEEDLEKLGEALQILKDQK